MKKKKKTMNIFFFYILLQKAALLFLANQTGFGKKIHEIGSTITKFYWIYPKADAKLLYGEE